MVGSSPDNFFAQKFCSSNHKDVLTFKTVGHAVAFRMRYCFVGCSGTMAEEVRALSVLLLCHKVRSISAPSRVAYARWKTSWRNVSLPYSAVHQQCEVPQYLGSRS